MDQEFTDHRPWGHYTILADEPNHKVKRIVVSPGKRFSLQRHQRRAEHWFVVSGEGRVTLDKELITLKPGEAVDIPTGTMHRMENPGEEELSFIEVQTGDYLAKMISNVSRTTLDGRAEIRISPCRQYPGFHGIVPRNPNRSR